MTHVRHFCVYFDSVFFSRGLALYDSLRRHAPDSRLWVLCLDRPCHEALARMDLPGVRCLTLSELEKDDAQLQGARENRSLLEYYLTCTPALPLFILDRHPEVDAVTFLDGDLFFFSDPEPLYTEIGDAPISITPHRYAERSPHRINTSGVYNDGWICFRRDPRAFACLRWWRERCIEWCYNRSEDGRFTEQKYLDDWPARFPGTRVVDHKGANAGPWNAENYEFRAEGGRVLVDGDPLIFFHFSGLKRINSWLYRLNLHRGRQRKLPSRILLRHVYAPYIQALEKAMRRAAPYLPQATLRTRGRVDHETVPWSSMKIQGMFWRFCHEYHGLRVGNRLLF